MKKYISVLVVILLLGCVGCNSKPYVSVATYISKDCDDVAYTRRYEVTEETENFYYCYSDFEGFWINKDPDIKNNLSFLWDDGDRIIEGKLVEGL